MNEVYIIVNPKISGDPLIVVKNNIVDAITVAKVMLVSTLEDKMSYMAIKTMVEKDKTEQSETLQQLKETGRCRFKNSESSIWIFYIDKNKG